MHPVQTQSSAAFTAAAATKALSLQHLTAALHTMSALLESSEAARRLAVASCSAAIEGSGIEAAARPGRQSAEAQLRPRVVIRSQGEEYELRPKQQLPLNLDLLEELRSASRFASDEARDCFPFTMKLILEWGKDKVQKGSLNISALLQSYSLACQKMSALPQ